MEEYFQELPSWRVTHVGWLIVRGMEDLHEDISDSMLEWRNFCSSSLLLLEDKQVLGGEDCNVLIFSIKYLEH